MTDTILPAVLSIVALYFIQLYFKKTRWKPKPTRYQLYGGPYDGKVLVTERFLFNYTDKNLRYTDRIGFYELVSADTGIYGTRESTPEDAVFGEEPLLLEDK